MVLELVFPLLSYWYRLYDLGLLSQSDLLRHWVSLLVCSFVPGVCMSQQHFVDMTQNVFLNFHALPYVRRLFMKELFEFFLDNPQP